MKRVWIVKELAYYTGVYYTESVHKNKASANKHCRDDGFKWSKSEECFDCEDRQLLREIEVWDVKEQITLAKRGERNGMKDKRFDLVCEFQSFDDEKCLIDGEQYDESPPCRGVYGCPYRKLKPYITLDDFMDEMAGASTDDIARLALVMAVFGERCELDIIKELRAISKKHAK
jgi:hypothetical protein